MFRRSSRHLARRFAFGDQLRGERFVEAVEQGSSSCRSAL
jgi:hypothetical protein